jgi:hypothetical protein
MSLTGPDLRHGHARADAGMRSLPRSQFDPVTQKEFYRLFAFFNNIDESGLYSHFTRAIPSPTLLL